MVSRLLSLFKRIKSNYKRPTAEVPLLVHQQGSEQKSGRNTYQIRMGQRVDSATKAAAFRELRKRVAKDVIQDLELVSDQHPFQKVITTNPLVTEITREGMLRILMERVSKDGVYLDQIVIPLLSSGILTNQETKNLEDAVRLACDLFKMLREWVDHLYQTNTQHQLEEALR
ncbi:accessory protein [Piparella virus]|nr:accessory protein [Piparella virus]